MNQVVFRVLNFKNEEPVERFLIFIPIREHTLKHLKDIYFLDAEEFLSYNALGWPIG